MTDFSANSAGPIGTAYEIPVPARISYAEPDVVIEATTERRFASACNWSPPIVLQMTVDPIRGMTDEEFFFAMFG